MNTSQYQINFFKRKIGKNKKRWKSYHKQK